MGRARQITPPDDFKYVYPFFHLFLDGPLVEIFQPWKVYLRPRVVRPEFFLEGTILRPRGGFRIKWKPGCIQPSKMEFFRTFVASLPHSCDEGGQSHESDSLIVLVGVMGIVLMSSNRHV